jgi:PAS domain S-box-containing protein
MIKEIGMSAKNDDISEFRVEWESGAPSGITVLGPSPRNGRPVSKMDVRRGHPSRDAVAADCGADDLRDSFGYFGPVLELAPVGYLLLDERGCILDANRLACDFLDYPEGDVHGESLAVFLEKDSRAILHQHLSAVLETVEPCKCRITVVSCGSAEPRHLRLDTRLLPGDRDAPPRCLCAATDVTDSIRKERAIENSLREKEVLVREVNHRVKNNLQLITSLINLQAGYSEDSLCRDRLRESLNRVRSMALVHERFYDCTDLSRADLAGFVEGLSRHLYHTYGVEPDKVRVVHSIEDVTLGIDQAIPCGLILNELVSNSLKYAFPGDNRGTVTVRVWRPESKTVALSVEDDGAGLPPGVKLESTETLGFHLVYGLTKQLEGEYVLRNGNGTGVEIRFPDHQSQK